MPARYEAWSGSSDWVLTCCDSWYSGQEPVGLVEPWGLAESDSLAMQGTDRSDRIPQKA
jgi:hypothetical protein